MSTTATATTTRSVRASTRAATIASRVNKVNSRELKRKVVKRKVEREPEMFHIEDGVYTLKGVYYTVLDGQATHFLTQEPVKRATVAFLRRLKECDNSSVLLEIELENLLDRSCYVHVKSYKMSVDAYGQVESYDSDEVTINTFEETVANRDNGTRTYNTEYCSNTVTIEWKYLDDMQTVRELPWWTDSESESSESDDDDEDSDEDSE
jgi:hypothetical protein